MERATKEVNHLKIVIAEDSVKVSEVLQRTLNTIEGFSVIGIAEDGVEAIRLVKELKPHLLILDISMPLKDGIEVLKEIRIEDSSTVIVMFTAEATHYARNFCIKAGANFYLEKSQLQELIEICTRVLLADD